MAWPAVKQGFSQGEFLRYVSGLEWRTWRPNKIVWHNTAAPTLAQWIKTAQEDVAKGLQPGITRIRNLERYFREDNGWSGCPHLFVANDFIWVMNPLTAPGTHSPSWNSTSIGIEMIGDFSKEDDETGVGENVKNNTIFATAVLCEKIGLEAIPGEVLRKSPLQTTGTIFLHKQDPRTTHDCPGVNIARDKDQMIQEVEALMIGGDHAPEPMPMPPIERGITLVGELNLRIGPGVTNPSRGLLPKDLQLEVLGRVPNGADWWLRVKTPAGYEGWVAARYVKIGE